MADPSAPAGNTAPGEICIPCHAGTLEVIVWKYAVCWDTPSPDGVDAFDPRFPQVTVRVSGGEIGQIVTQTTGSDGKVIFDSLLPGTYRIEVEKPGYEDVTSTIQDRLTRENPPRVRLTTSAEIQSHQTSYADLVLRAMPYRQNADGTWTQGRECERRHTFNQNPSGGAGSLDAILWSDEPGMLSARDWAWIFILVLVATTLGLGIANLMGHWPLFLSGLLAAFAGFLTGIIFGEGPGIAAIATAAAGFAALAIALIFIMMGGLHDKQTDGAFIAAIFGILTGVWAAFGVGYLGGRLSTWEAEPEWWSNTRLLVMALASGAVAALICLALGAGMGLSAAALVLTTLLALVVGCVLGHLSALTGMAFANEGKVQQWGDSDYKLPYAGERYCLQGARGYWSHYRTAKEGCYDWAMPDRTPVLASKEGHITAYYDQTAYNYVLPLPRPDDDKHPTNSGNADYGVETQGDDATNYVSVRHRDGSVAFYSWLMTNGARGRDWNRALQSELGEGTGSPGGVGRAGAANPVHVRPGHVLGGCGWTDSDHPVTDELFPNQPLMWPWIVGAATLVVTTLLVVVLALTHAGPPPNHIGSGFDKDEATNSYCPPYSELAHSNEGEDRTAQNACADMRNQPELPALSSPPAHSVIGDMFDKEQGFDNQFCEVLQPGAIKQPWAAWSAPLGFGICGMAYLIIFAVNGPNGKPFKNRMTTTWYYPLTLGLILIVNGPGSMIFHATFLGWWSQWDPCGMCLFTAFVFAYNITRIFNTRHYETFWLIFLGTTILAIVLIFTNVFGDSKPVFALTVGLAFVSQFLTVFPCHIVTDHKGLAWFWGGLLVFIVALVIWMLGQTGHPFCSSRDIAANFPWPHPVWHFMGAFAMFCFGMSFIYQKDPEPCYPRLHFTVLEAPPPGPPVDQPEPQSTGASTSHDRYLTVKFQDGSTAIHGNQPRSMRKYQSSNASIGLPTIPSLAQFRPEGGGEHEPEPAGSGGT